VSELKHQLKTLKEIDIGMEKKEIGISFKIKGQEECLLKIY